MEKSRIIEIKEDILSKNKEIANQIREQLSREKVYMINLMGSPGSGKTCLASKTIEFLCETFNIAFVKADIYPKIDTEKVAAFEIIIHPIHMGGSCQVNADMITKAINSLPLEELDLIILENVGNLICPAECDTGAFKNIVVLSIPEGDWKFVHG